jgi:hypothetical protein
MIIETALYNGLRRAYRARIFSFSIQKPAGTKAEALGSHPLF